MIKMAKNGESGDLLALHFQVKTNEKWFKRTKVVMLMYLLHTSWLK